MTRYEMMVIRTRQPALGTVISPNTLEIRSRAEAVLRGLDPRIGTEELLDGSGLYLKGKTKVNAAAFVWQLISGFTSEGWEPFNTLFDKSGGESFYLRRRIDD